MWKCSGNKAITLMRAFRRICLSSSSPVESNFSYNKKNRDEYFSSATRNRHVSKILKKGKEEGTLNFEAMI